MNNIKYYSLRIIDSLLVFIGALATIYLFNKNIDYQILFLFFIVYKISYYLEKPLFEEYIRRKHNDTNK